MKVLFANIVLFEIGIRKFLQQSSTHLDTPRRVHQDIIVYVICFNHLLWNGK
jgi:hypothetical protein